MMRVSAPGASAYRLGRMTNAFKYLTSVLFVTIVVQVALAGYGVFYTLRKANKTGSASESAFDHGYHAHAILGTVILVVMILLVLAALVGKLGSTAVRFSVALLVAGILQMVFAALGRSVPVLGFLHVVNALAIYAAAALLAHRTWTTRSDPATAAA
jgi:hypothetical protein